MKPPTEQPIISDEQAAAYEATQQRAAADYERAFRVALASGYYGKDQLRQRYQRVTPC